MSCARRVAIGDNVAAKKATARGFVLDSIFIYFLVRLVYSDVVIGELLLDQDGVLCR
jgi:hypothetical protein